MTRNIRLIELRIDPATGAPSDRALRAFADQERGIAAAGSAAFFSQMPYTEMLRAVYEAGRTQGRKESA
ncbi:hypothetical protein [Streptomyces sp. AC495_CC817]|uniref:hypothetical protein n=1 Tax=Streptomyces sp. AC495_CC817 TaxID=2823900 RepID=UPI001C261163|nr:hypothetical protein [Streptomyces sp. AC495_CC817]